MYIEDGEFCCSRCLYQEPIKHFCILCKSKLVEEKGIYICKQCGYKK